MVRVLLFLLLFTSNALAQTLYCGQDTGLSAKVTLSNLAKYSEQIDNAEWLSAGVTETANTVIAPDGTLTADTTTASAGNATHYFYSAGTNRPAAGTTERMSLYVKKGTHRYVGFFHDNTDRFGMVLDLDTPTTPYHVTGLSSYSITSVGNGWYRVVMSYTRTAASARIWYISLRPNTTSSTSTVSWTAAGTETVYIWGIQLNNQSSPPDYLQSVASATTLAGVCAAGTTQSPTDPSKCIALGDEKARKW
jgi:hypothetical protein